MIKVHERLFVGDELDCRNNASGIDIVHACKHPCHVNAVGYRDKLTSSHPNYLFIVKKDNLYLNMIDPPAPLFKIEMFHKFMEFMSIEWSAEKNILIHCNKGLSRAPSLALLFMAKSLNIIKLESFVAAKNDFASIIHAYDSVKGIIIFLERKWTSIA